MTKSSRTLAPAQGERGQISIFFSASLVVLITIVAFVINIGLFVKAKINLQNATDSAAFAGAAVQARQLTTIGHLNWEMRNIYKEWMFKYYVVGNLNIEHVENPAAASDAVSYRLRTTTNTLETNPTRRVMEDPYNFPSVCIHLANSETNLCKRYSVPGLPEFGSSNLPGAEQASRAFMNSLIGAKILDCVDQTRLNMLVNLTWAYNVMSPDGTETIVDGGPQILADRIGAWPKAIEVAMRIRNLEKAVNRPPESGGVCASRENNGKVTCGKTIDQISSEKLLGNERIVKAFFSGYRNLGNEIETEMKDSFTLTEIPPKATQLGGNRSASYLLVPQTQAQNYQKQYLDLHLMMVNYATFYNAFIPRASNDGSVPVSGACDVSKVAMPVPGYPMGFYKSPDILTYYAVRGEAEFTGMFNPFTDGVVKLTAYSAAKPFGGRIGPMLFFQPPNAGYFQGRTDPQKKRSIPYITSLEFGGTPHPITKAPIEVGDFAPGIPLPINFPNEYFWLKEPTDALGGYADDVKFGVPNMVYDYQSGFTNTGYTNAAQDINIIQTKNPAESDQAIGLFSKFQLQQFKGTALNTNVSQEILTQELKRIKAPTLYEAANYLVPSPEDLNRQLNLDSVGFVSGKKTDVNGLSNYQVNIYAPLISPDREDVFWRNGQDVVFTVFEFLREQERGIQKYKENMIQAAIEINNQGNNLASEATGAREGFTRAARGVADVDFTGGKDQQVGSCESIAGVFLNFYYGDSELGGTRFVTNNAGCPQTLGTNLRAYFNSTSGTGGFSPSHYLMDYTYNPAMQRAPNSLFSAYMPGAFTGIQNNGVYNNPIAGSNVEDETMRRNFYSTKFVQLNSLRSNGPWKEVTSNFVIYSEGDVETAPGLNRSQKEYLNTLDAESIGIDPTAIRY